MFLCVCISNSMYKSCFSVQICTQSVISVLKHTPKSTPGIRRVVSCSVDTVLKLYIWVPSTVAPAVWTGGPPEGLPPLHLLDGSGLAVVEWITDREPYPHSPFGARQFLVEISSCNQTCLGVCHGVAWLDTRCPQKPLYNSPSSSGQGRENIQ